MPAKFNLMRGGVGSDDSYAERSEKRMWSSLSCKVVAGVSIGLALTVGTISMLGGFSLDDDDEDLALLSEDQYKTRLETLTGTGGSNNSSSEKGKTITEVVVPQNVIV